MFRFHYRTKGNPLQLTLIQFTEANQLILWSTSTAALISRRIIQPDPADDPEPDSDSEPEKDEEDEVEKLRKQKKELKRQLGLMQERVGS